MIADPRGYSDELLVYLAQQALDRGDLAAAGFYGQILGERVAAAGLLGDARPGAHYQHDDGSVYVPCGNDWCQVVPGGMMGAAFGDLGTTAESVIEAIGKQVQGTIQSYGEAKAGKSLQDSGVTIAALVIAGIVAAKLINIF